MREYNFIHYEDIPSAQILVKFKEFYFDRSGTMAWQPTDGDTYYRINLELAPIIILNHESDLATINDMVGKFFT